VSPEYREYREYCVPGISTEEGRNRLPAAMLAGVVDTLWSFENLFDAVMGGEYAIAA